MANEWLPIVIALLAVLWTTGTPYCTNFDDAQFGCLRRMAGPLLLRWLA